MHTKEQQLSPESEEKNQAARIITVLIWVLLGAFLFVAYTGLKLSDWKLISVTMAACAFLIVPFAFLRHQQMHSSSIAIALIMLVALTAIASIGQGIRDLAILGFPIVFIFAGLTIRRMFFRLYVALALVAVCWLNFGETYGWFVTKPFNIGENANWLYLIYVTIILLVAALSVDLLATNLQNNLANAKLEIEQRKLAEAEVEKRERRFQALIEHGRDNISMLTKDGTLVWESPSANSTLGYVPNQFVGGNIFDLMHPEDQAWTQEMYTYVVQTPGNIREGEFRLLHADGAWRWIECTATNLLDEPIVHAVVLNYRDITERKKIEEELQEKEIQYRNLADSGTALIWKSGTDKLCNYFNKPWLRFTGRTLEQEMGNGWAEGVHPDDFDHCLATYNAAFDKQEAFEMDYRLRHFSGEYHWIQDLGTPNYNSNKEFVGYIGHCFDITERKRVEDQLRYQGTHDILTGIYNRTFFEEELARFERGREYPISIIIGDIDGLKQVNDTRGHATGDELLKQAADALGTVFRAEDVLARIGGDEFAVLLPKTDFPSVENLVSRIRERLLENNKIHPDLPVHISLGAATAETEDLIGTFKLADQRMYADKSKRILQTNHPTIL